MGRKLQDLADNDLKFGSFWNVDGEVSRMHTFASDRQDYVDRLSDLRVILMHC